MTTLNQAVRTLNARRQAEAALTNEQLTRQRVERLEYEAEAEKKRAEATRAMLVEFYGRRFMERVRWLILGR